MLKYNYEKIRNFFLKKFSIRWVADDDDWRAVTTIPAHKFTVWNAAWNPTGTILGFIFLKKKVDFFHIFFLLLIQLLITLFVYIVSCSDDLSLKFWKYNATGNDFILYLYIFSYFCVCFSELTFELLQSIENVSDRSLYAVTWSRDDVVAVACGNNNIELYKHVRWCCCL